MTEEEFTGFKRKHYRVRSGPCWDACKAYREAYDAITASNMNFAVSVGGIGFYEGSTENVGNGLAISAVTFDGPLPKGWKRRNWRSFTGLKTGHTAAWPDQRTSEGKAALKAIKALPLFPLPDRVCDAIGFPTSLSYEKEGASGTESLGFFRTIGIGWIDDTFYVSLPDIVGQRARKIEQGYTVTTPEWHILDGMEPILKEEADLDYARNRAAKAAA